MVGGLIELCGGDASASRCALGLRHPTFNGRHFFAKSRKLFLTLEHPCRRTLSAGNVSPVYADDYTAFSHDRFRLLQLIPPGKRLRQVISNKDPCKQGLQVIAIGRDMCPQCPAVDTLRCFA